MYIQRRQTLINAVRLLTRDEPAVFFCTYLRSTSFCHVCSPLSKQLRPALSAADPRLSRHTEVYGGAVKCIDVAFQIKHFGRPLMSCFRYHVVGKILKDAVVSPLVCFG